MTPVQDLRSGTAFLLDGQPYVCLKYEHIKMGRGSATIKIKAKSLLSGATTEKAFINSARVEEIDTKRRLMNYSYREGENFVFLDPTTYEQASMTGGELGDNAKYLKENLQVTIFFWDEKPLWIELPPKLEFVVASTDPGVKGNSVSNLYKSAVLENGIGVRVPLFINEGEKVMIDTRDGSYTERAKG